MEELRKRVEDALQKIRPQLQADGGDVELLKVEADGTVQVRLTGTCRGCPFSTFTLQRVIETILKKEVPEVKRVEAA